MIEMAGSTVSAGTLSGYTIRKAEGGCKAGADGDGPDTRPRRGGKEG